MQALSLLAGGLAAGLVAGTASCAAAQGGLLVGLLGRQGRDAAPVAWFLAGRLASYTAAGALLGLLGAAVSPPPWLRALLLVAAGTTVAGFAVRLLRRGQVACAPAAGARSPLRAPLLGAATVLVPCGVTLGMEMIAVSSGSAVAGAAVMAGFVLGSSPAFALLGYLLRRMSRGRLARVAAAAGIAAGVWTVGTGINLGGWLSAPPPASAVAAPPPASGPASAGGAHASPPADGGQTVVVWATRTGYRPFMVEARAGVPVAVDFRVAEPGCTGTVTIDGRDVALPAVVRLPPQPPGSLRYVCGMGMYTGFINFS
ncbi:sulfite exporter TauE/SafE family protein [Nonomuraea pusilla]|uniref:Sulfite exporter TauE/SafE n=1 Tax=Nonomuraea pusilla TaxID=46177 RepID=A0A1H8B1F8_9ACTN|nr:sulfite exporter TauE/SafE family protein [Nonomuraea pusilla]SEM76596.1 Sulfite exporter TauE/SafE [Nonomuraea pusilla]